MQKRIHTGIRTRTARQAEPEEPPHRTGLEKIANFIKSLGEWRDRALVIIGVLYAAGYFIWSAYASANNLGLLPALQFQYVVAGLGPVAIGIVVIGGGLWLWRWLNNIWLKNLETNRRQPWPLVLAGFRLAAFFMFAGFLYGGYGPSVLLALALLAIAAVRGRKWGVWNLALAAGIILVWINHESINRSVFSWLLEILPQDSAFLWSSYLLAVVAIFGGSTLLGEWLSRFYRVLYFLILAIVLIVLGLLSYIRLYTQLPQEFGGVSPRCALLDVKAENLSLETRNALFPPSEENQNTSILQSERLDVLFTSSSIVMVKAQRPAAGTEDTVYEIPRSNIQAIAWCK